MALYLKLIIVAIVLVVLVMGVFGLKLLSDKSGKFDVNADPEKYKKMEKDGIYNVYKEQNTKQKDNKDS